MSATILAFSQPFRAASFSLSQRSAIIAAAMAVSQSWGVAFHQDDEGFELATIGRQAGGDSAAFDTFGLGLVPEGVELVALDTPEKFSIHDTIDSALETMWRSVIV